MAKKFLHILVFIAFCGNIQFCKAQLITDTIATIDTIGTIGTIEVIGATIYLLG